MTYLDKNTKVEGRFWLNIENQHFLAEGKVKLLELIDELGSISQAAEKLKMSYKAAWEMVERINRFAGKDVVIKEKGGRGGGGAYVTDTGKKIIQLFKDIEVEHKKWCEKIESDLKKYEIL